MSEDQQSQSPTGLASLADRLLGPGVVREPVEYKSLPPCTVCGAHDACGTDDEGGRWNHTDRDGVVQSILPGFDALPVPAVPAVFEPVADKPAWNGYHSIICPADCDGTPDGVTCDCRCHESWYDQLGDAFFRNFGAEAGAAR